MNTPQILLPNRHARFVVILCAYSDFQTLTWSCTTVSLMSEPLFLRQLDSPKYCKLLHLARTELNQLFKVNAFGIKSRNWMYCKQMQILQSDDTSNCLLSLGCPACLSSTFLIPIRLTSTSNDFVVGLSLVKGKML